MLETNLYAMNRIAIICLCLLSANLLAQNTSTTSEVWTPKLQMQFRSIMSTSISPDGSHVAYVVRSPIMTEEKSEYSQQIWVAASNSDWNEQYTYDESNNYSPAFSSSGENIAFISTRSGKPQIWLMRVKGGEARQITDVKGGVSRIAWDPSVERLAFLQKDPETEEEAAAKKGKTDVILVDQNYKYTHLYTIGIEESDEPKQLTSGEMNILSFEYSPDGKQIVFDYSPTPSLNESYYQNTNIAIVPTDSGKVEVLVDRPGIDGSPKFSPDGKYVAFRTTNRQSDPIGLSDLAIVNITEKEITKLPDTFDRQASLVDWVGNDLYYSEDQGTARVLKTMSVNRASSSSEMNFTINENSLGAATGVSARYSVSPNGEIAMTYQSLTDPEEVYFIKHKDIDPKQLSYINQDVEYKELAKTEIIQWKSKDGTAVEGLITYPIGYEKGKRYPVVINVHGGPNGVFSQRFAGRPSIYMLQYFAQQGYVVVQPNPRGSSGYGKAFRYANFKDWGYGDFEDVVSGVDKAIAMGVADPNNQFLMGWSYGGYMTSFAVTKTDRFNAASMGAGLPNLVSMTTTTDIPDYLVAHMGGEYWNDYETYEKHSAMYGIKNVITPTQVIHGQNDLRVPFTQGQEFYVALQRLGIDTEMIVYPRTPHGPREPKFLMDVAPRIIAWFEKYKK